MRPVRDGAGHFSGTVAGAPAPGLLERSALRAPGDGAALRRASSQRVFPVSSPLHPRLPNRPVINTPVVSATVYSEGAALPSPLERPVLVEHVLLETEERSKPVCVFWNHSIT